MFLYLPDRSAALDAADIVARLGPAAAVTEAAARATRSRDLGNVVRFCRWRQVERLVRLLSLPAAPGTVH